MTACNQSAQIAEEAAAVTVAQPVKNDTAGLAAYQNWKAMNELSDDESYNNSQKAVAAAPVRKVTAKATPVRRVASAPVRRSSPSTARSSGSSDGVDNSSGTISSESAEAAKKKGLSKAAKGAIIGGVAGGVAGAVINKKNRGAGAVVGAVIGAGGGYVLGRQQDKKDGRIDFQMK